MADMTTDPTLRQELAELRAAVNRLEAAAAARLHLRVDAPAARPFLGQPLPLTAGAAWFGAGASQTPAGDMPLTFVTSWGLLRAVGEDGFTTQIGASVTTRTGLDGVARVTLLSPGAADLDVAQQSALRTALDRLDPNAATPADLQPQLNALVDGYRWEANLLLRQAIDILYGANGAPLDAVNPEDALAAWRYANATVVALAGGDPLSAAFAAVRVLDWFPPWLQIYHLRTQSDDSLARDLDRTRRRQTDPHALLDGVYNDINQYVNHQLGQVGQLLGQRAAENALRAFVHEGLAEATAATRAELFPSLHTASTTVATAGVHVLGALTQGRADLRQEVDAQVKTVDNRLDGRIGSVEQALGAKLDAGDFQGFRSQVDASLSALDGQTRTLVTQVSAASAASAALQGQFSALQTSFGQLTTNFGTLQDSLGRLSGRIGDVAADLTQQLAARVTAADLSALQTSLQASLDSALQLKADSQAVDSLRGELTAQLAARATTDALATLQSSINAALALKADGQALTTLRTQLTNQLNTRATVDALGALQTSITSALALKADTQAMNTLRTELTNQLATRLSAADLAAFQSTMDAALALKADSQAVDTLRGDLSAQLDARVTADAFKSFQDANTAALNRKANTASLTSLRNELTAQIAGKVDQAALDAFRQEADGRFADLVANTEKFASQLTDVNSSLSEIRDRFGGLQQDFTLQLDANQQALAQALATVTQLQGTVGDLSTNLTTRLTGLEDQTKGVSTSLGDFQDTISNLNRDFSRLNKRIVDSGLLRPPPP